MSWKAGQVESKGARALYVKGFVHTRQGHTRGKVEGGPDE